MPDTTEEIIKKSKKTYSFNWQSGIDRIKRDILMK